MRIFTGEYLQVMERGRMRNFDEKHPHVIENVGCRCKICEGSILKSKKRQDVDAIYI